MGLLERIAAARGQETRSSVDQWIEQYLLPSSQFNQFNYNGTTYPLGLNMTWTADRAKEITNSLPGYAAALRVCPPAFAAQMVRAVVLSQARFTFRNLPSSPTARRTFGTRALGLLEKPWPKATTGQLIARMEWHAGLAGNSFVYRRPDRLRVLRPDWVAILFGSDREPEDPSHAIDGEVIGYVYQNGGIGNALSKPVTLLPDEVAHWSPQPDPERAEIGMSWITPAVRDLQADRAATEHKLNFFANGATPNMVVKGIPAATKDQFDEIVEAMESKHRGVANAYRTLYLTAGADATVVGSNLSEINIGGVQGASETRISFLSRVPASLLGIADGMKGSSLNAGNYGETRRTFSDSWVYPTLQDLCAALSPLLQVPADAELWFDVADMPILREDSKDAAQIEQVKAVTITTYVKEGFTPESAIAAVRGQDVTLLKHTGMVSVQLQPPGSTPPDATVPMPDANRGGGVGPKGGGPEARKFNPEQPRIPGGHHGGGEWSATGAIKDALKLGDKADLQPGEKLIGSDKVAGDSGTIRMALVDHGGAKSLRLGIGGAGFGARDDEAGPWRAGPDRTAQINAERKKLRDEQDSLQAEWDRLDADPHADVARKAAVEKRLEELDDTDTAEVFPGGYTANVDQATAERLKTALTEQLDAAAKVQSVVDAHYDKIDRLEAQRDKLRGMHRKWTDAEEARWDDLTAQIEALQASPPEQHGGTYGDYFSTEGSIPGEWADIHYAVYLDDPSIGVQVRLGALPHGSGETLSDLSGNEQAAQLDPAEAERFLRLLGRFTGSGESQQRAAGHDTTPGHDELHHYWTVGKGRREWVDSPKPWTTLVANLVRVGVPLEKAKVYASRWFIEVKGYAAGSDINRVVHGKPPRGNKVGPG